MTIGKQTTTEFREPIRINHKYVPAGTMGLSQIRKGETTPCNFRSIPLPFE